MEGPQGLQEVFSGLTRQKAGAVAGLGSLASHLCEIAVLHGLVDRVPWPLVSVFCQVF